MSNYLQCYGKINALNIALRVCLIGIPSATIHAKDAHFRSWALHHAVGSLDGQNPGDAILSWMQGSDAAQFPP